MKQSGRLKDTTVQKQLDYSTVQSDPESTLIYTQCKLNFLPMIKTGMLIQLDQIYSRI